MFSRALGSAAATSTTVSPERVEATLENQRGKQCAVDWSTPPWRTAAARRGRPSPLCDSNHCPSVNGAEAEGSIGMPMLAERTAATTHSLLNAGATEAKDASPHSGAALRHRRAGAAGERSRHPNRRRSSGRASAVAAHTTGPAARRRLEHQRRDRSRFARASRGVGTSGVPGQAHTARRSAGGSDGPSCGSSAAGCSPRPPTSRRAAPCSRRHRRTAAKYRS